MKKALIFALSFAFAIAPLGCTNKEETSPADSTANSDVSLTEIASSSVQPQNTTHTPSPDEYIAPNMALKIATAHAGVGEVTDQEVELDYENGKAIYEVSFDSGKIEYEYEIDAITGDVLYFESEKDD